MKSMLSYALNAAAVGFWIFRVIVLVCATMDISFPVKPVDVMVELPILFITLFCLILVIKKNVIGALLYLAIYVGYFGYDLFNAVNGSANILVLNVAISLFAMLIPLANLLEILLGNNKTTVKATKPTDWFYQNKKFDRELDERADKNNYRIN